MQDQEFVFPLEKGVKYKIFPDQYLLTFQNGAISIHDLSIFTILYQEQDMIVLRAKGQVRHLPVLHILRDRNENVTNQEGVSPLESYFYELGKGTVDSICDGTVLREEGTGTNQSKEEYSRNNGPMLNEEGNRTNQFREVDNRNSEVVLREEGTGTDQSKDKSGDTLVKETNQTQCRDSVQQASNSPSSHVEVRSAGQDPLSDQESAVEETAPNSLESLLKALSTNPDIERAINKSLYLSRGRILDTNWDSVENRQDWGTVEKKRRIRAV